MTSANINSTRSPSDGTRTIHVVQGDQASSSDPSVVLSTVLGSCVSVCLYDERMGVGGLNHFLLPGDASIAAGREKYGVFAMEKLVNKLLRMGADRRRFQAKIFGGAKVIDGLSDIGARNVEFALQFLGTEGFPVVSKSVGGTQARRLQFIPATGAARVKLLEDAREVAPMPRPAPKPEPVGDVELF